MNANDIALILAVFIASAVESVEAVTIVLAAGTARDWRSARQGVAAALLTLAAIVALLGPAIAFFPIDSLRLVVGALLLVFGLQWLRKATLRASGFKALHDEDAIFREELAAAKAARGEKRLGIDDWYAFTLAFKGVLLEGIEVVFIVLTFGALQGRIGIAAGAALAAVVIVSIAGILVHKPLSRVPENTMKFVVGLTLTTFGIFWATEGTGVIWAWGDATLAAILAVVAAKSAGLVWLLRRRHAAQVAAGSTPKAKLAAQPKLPKILQFVYDFVIGDDWPTALGLYAALAVSWLVVSSQGPTNAVAVWLVAAAVVAIHAFRLVRFSRK